MNIEAILQGGDCPRILELKGRLGWTMYELVKAGPGGVTTLECPAPRWSGYVHKLRRRGVPIDTAMEAHGGPYCGRHARYRLTCDVSLKVMNAEGRR